MAASNAGSRSRGCPVVRAAVPMAVARRARFPTAHPAGGPAWSNPLRSPLSLAPDLTQIRLKVHLDRVTLRGDVALLHLRFRG
jgi:hypothetical protein